MDFGLGVDGEDSDGEEPMRVGPGDMDVMIRAHVEMNATGSTFYAIESENDDESESDADPDETFDAEAKARDPSCGCGRINPEHVAATMRGYPQVIAGVDGSWDRQDGGEGTRWYISQWRDLQLAKRTGWCVLDIGGRVRFTFNAARSMQGRRTNKALAAELESTSETGGRALSGVPNGEPLIRHMAVEVGSNLIMDWVRVAGIFMPDQEWEDVENSKLQHCEAKAAVFLLAHSGCVEGIDAAPTMPWEEGNPYDLYLGDLIRRLALEEQRLVPRLWTRRHYRQRQGRQWDYHATLSTPPCCFGPRVGTRRPYAKSPSCVGTVRPYTMAGGSHSRSFGLARTGCGGRPIQPLF